jgi:hypothetical protein
MASAALLLSMGAHLHVDGIRTRIPLPFFVVAHLPLLKSSVAARYSMFFWLFTALILGVVLDAVRHSIGKRTLKSINVLAGVASCGVAVVVLLPLIPSWPYAADRWSTPTWFTSSARSLRVGSGVLIYPMSAPGDASAMVWQADAHLAFRMPGGYAVFATSSGLASFSGPSSTTQMALSLCSSGTRLSLPDAVLRDQLAKWKVGLVAVVKTATGARCAESLVESALGPPTSRGQVMLWSVNDALAPLSG